MTRFPCLSVRLAVLAVGCWCAVAASGNDASAAVITGLSAVGNSEDAGFGRLAINTVNGSGLTGLQHGTADNTMWQTAAASPAVPATLTITLPTDPLGAWNITSIRIWNLNDASFYYRGAKDIVVATSLNGVDYTDRLTTTLLSAPETSPGSFTPTTTYTGELFTPGTPWFGVQFVRITINSILDAGQGHVGLSEVQLTGYIPEPASAGLVAAGGAVLLVARRRR